jgi:nucleoside-diphosphate-sugar epimerase
LNVVTGGAGFFGQILVQKLLARGEGVTVLDLNKPHWQHPRLRVFQGDIRDKVCVAEAFKGASVIYHNIAQVPLAKDASLFWSVNRDGTAVALQEAAEARVSAFVYTSSSAVFGVPATNPVTEKTRPTPAEDYGRAKLAGEELCHDFSERGLRISIIRPRTILGHGRLGIFQILFEWIYKGRNVPVLGRGDNIYQFVHADDLADACILAGQQRSEGIYNIGADGFMTMRQSLEGLIAHAKSKSRVKSVPRQGATMAMRLTSGIGLTPLAPYHALMYGESLYFDTRKAKSELGFTPRYTQAQALADAYDWYVANREDVLAGRVSGSKHQSKLRQGLLGLVPYFI